MTLAEAVAATMFVGITLYALLAGADFGAGVWDLVAGGARRGAAVRTLIAASIGPVWEANHVWLIFVLVVLWTGFPTAFAAIMATHYIPLTLAAIGIILRGSAFAFRKAPGSTNTQRLFGATFALSSVITPFFLGAVVGGVASGRVPSEGRGDVWRSWWNPTSILGGLMAVVVCAFLAAVYLVADAQRRGRPDLVRHFVVRASASSTVAGLVALVGVFVLRHDAPELYHGLTHRGAPLIVASAVAGAGTLWLLARGKYAPARYGAALAVTAVLWGWAAGQYPYLLEPTLTIEQGAGADATLTAMLATLGVGTALLAPALVWLFVLVQRGTLTDPHE
ncbi:MAG: cytochrome d ubiquinol oxidase subunit II [Actinomycetota bacterium]